MKKTIYRTDNNHKKEYAAAYIPFRVILAILIILFEMLAIIGIVVALCYFVPYFYLLAWLTEIGCVIKIVASDDNPEYKVPWLLVVLLLPIAGFMLYFLFYSRKLQKRFIRRWKRMKEQGYLKDDRPALTALKQQDPVAATQAHMLCNIAEAHLFKDTKQTYFPLGEDMWKSLLADLQTAKKFIYMEYFIVEAGDFWNSILDILKAKAAQGVEVRVVYDDIGCMRTLPGNYAKTLSSYGIKAAPFSRLKGNADSEFNNRSHRKITVIDGKIGYTGGVNLADEYINAIVRFGHWKDIGIRLEGDAVWELTHLFLMDYGINVKELPNVPMGVQHYPIVPMRAQGYVIPFGDGPNPMYERRVGKSVIQSMLSATTEYAWIMTPYLIIDNDLCTSLENTALKGVDVRILVPHIPDKKLVFGITRSFYHRLMAAGVKIYEYKPGFLHAKAYLVDGKYAMIGTINLDYRSLVHHFENGVWLYDTQCIRDIKADFDDTLAKCIHVQHSDLKIGLLQRLVRSIVRIFAPLL